MNSMRRCHDCGQPLGKKELFCPRCGAKQPRKIREPASRQRQAEANGKERP